MDGDEGMIGDPNPKKSIKNKLFRVYLCGGAIVTIALLKMPMNWPSQTRTLTFYIHNIRLDTPSLFSLTFFCHHISCVRL